MFGQAARIWGHVLQKYNVYHNYPFCISHHQGGLEEAVAQSSLRPTTTPMGCSLDLAYSG